MVLMVMTQGIDRDFCRLAALSSGTGRPSCRHSTQCAALQGPHQPQLVGLGFLAPLSQSMAFNHAIGP